MNNHSLKCSSLTHKPPRTLLEELPGRDTLRLTCLGRWAVWLQDPDRFPADPRYKYRMCHPGPETRQVWSRTSIGLWLRGRPCCRPTAGEGTRMSAGVTWCFHLNSRPGDRGRYGWSPFFLLSHSVSAVRDTLQSISSVLTNYKVSIHPGDPDTLWTPFPFPKWPIMNSENIQTGVYL